MAFESFRKERRDYALIVIILAGITKYDLIKYVESFTTSPLSYSSVRVRSSPLDHIIGSSSISREADSTIRDERIEKVYGNGVVPDRKKKITPQVVAQLYVTYATKLWRQTNHEEREKLAAQKALSAVKRVKNLMEGEEYVDLSLSKEGESSYEVNDRIKARDQLLLACNNMLEHMEITRGYHKKWSPEKDSKLSSDNKVASRSSKDGTSSTNDTKRNPLKKKKKSRSILFGAIMGAMVSCWVFSGNIMFTVLFTLMTVLGQLEYYRMVMKAGIYPARRISILGACAMFVTALFAPNLHQTCLPIFATYAMIWFLTMRRTVTTIPEIATTFTGMFYLGYIPSFWVRIRLIGTQVFEARGTTRLGPFLSPILDPTLNYLNSKGINSPITKGAVFIFWTWISIAFADVGAYFAGRRFGKTKLGELAPAAGAASPNKTFEGYIGGSILSASFACLGAWIMRWPYWYLTGPLHGVMLAFLGLVGDLTASMLKRDSGIKDFGDILPEHGGIMDRVDSFIFTAPYSWLIISCVIPSLRVGCPLITP